jgi:hypothetical protein
MPRFEAARALLFTQEGEDKFEMYVQVHIGGGFMSKMRVLTDLEHPLFLKYQFDAKDFMAGAKGAFEGLTRDVLHSDEMREYVSRQVHGGGMEESFTAVENEIKDFIRQSEEQQQQQQQKTQVAPESVKKVDTEHKEHPDSDQVDSGADEEVLDNIPADTAASSTAEDASSGSVEFLRSVCTEEGFQDFVRIVDKELLMKDKFVITDETIDSYYLSKAVINVVEEGTCLLLLCSDETPCLQYKSSQCTILLYIVLCIRLCCIIFADYAVLVQC